MEHLTIAKKKDFVGRKKEYADLEHLGVANEACIIIMYGRRRIGKTELLEQVFRERKIIKFEGIEGLNESEERHLVLKQLVRYTGDSSLLKRDIESWTDVFLLIFDYIKEGKWTLYFEELQWLASYKDTLIAELKFVWDNYFRRNNQLIILLCGSAPSFMINQVVHSKALYNRSQHEIYLREFNLIDAVLFFPKRSKKEILDGYLTMGGVPEYFRWLSSESSVFLSLCKHSFSQNGFFVREYDKIFTSVMAKNQHYKQIIELLAKKKFMSRNEMAASLHISSGGMFSAVLDDLEKSGFIDKYSPFNMSDHSIVTRYAISDPYLHFYFKFIKSQIKRIANGDFDKTPQMAIKSDNYYKWLGFAFERWCKKYHYVIAKILGFSGIQYRFGSYFSRHTDRVSPGYQIDLIFDRADNVYTICEIKYLQSKVSSEVIEEMERKLSLFPVKSHKTISKVLICTLGAEASLAQRGYFDAIITIDMLFDPHYWQ